MKFGKVISTTERVAFELKGGEPLVVDMAKLPDTMLRQLAAHGIKQKVMDHYNTKATDNASARVLAQEMIARLFDGTAFERSSGGGSDLAEALAAATGKPIEDCIIVIRGMEAKERRALERHPDVATALAKIKADRAKDAPKPDLGGLFS